MLGILVTVSGLLAVIQIPAQRPTVFIPREIGSVGIPVSQKILNNFACNDQQYSLNIIASWEGIQIDSIKADRNVDTFDHIPSAKDELLHFGKLRNLGVFCEGSGFAIEFSGFEKPGRNYNVLVIYLKDNKVSRVIRR